MESFSSSWISEISEVPPRGVGSGNFGLGKLELFPIIFPFIPGYLQLNYFSSGLRALAEPKV